jgi:hypothetical protein
VFGNGTRFVWQAGAEEEQIVEGALVHHVEARLVAMHEGEGGGVGEALESGGDAVDGGDCGGIRGNGVEHAGLDGPGTAHAPGSGDHLFDESEFQTADGAESLDVQIEKSLKRLGRFVLENQAAGQEAVDQGV